MERLTGVGVSPGVAFGRAVVLAGERRGFRYHVPPARMLYELQRLNEAREFSRRQIQDIKAQFGRTAGAAHAYLFDAQLLMLDDPMLVERASTLIREQLVNAAWAVQIAFDELSAIFDGIQDTYLRERRGDVADVVGRLHMNLDRDSPGPRGALQGLEGPLILVADDVAPSLVAELEAAGVKGFVTDAGSGAHHTSILARSLGVAAVAGVRDAARRIPPGAAVIVDGVSGIVDVDPSDEAIASVRERQEALAARERSLMEYRNLPAVTRDGLRITLDANIEFPVEAAAVRAHGADGIGLFRSEFLLVERSPADVDEELQVNIYRTMATQTAPAWTTIRTFDIADAGVARRASAADSMRGRVAIEAGRAGVTREALIRTQLRALIRASAFGGIRILIPFVASLEEWRAARTLFAEARAEVAARGQAMGSPPVGVLIEVPSAALTADLIAPEADFMSLGTNDLTQYALALDRTPEGERTPSVSLHPAVLRLIRHVQRAAARRATPLSLCGEMAADPIILALLIGLGVTSFSMAPASIPAAKKAVREIRTSDVRRIAARALRLSTAGEVGRYLTSSLSRLGQEAVAAESPALTPSVG